MKWARFEVNGQVRYGFLQENRLSEVAGDIFGTYQPTGQVYELDKVKFLAPVVPGKIIIIGLNYLKHIGEFFDKTLPEEPVMFMVSPSAVIGCGEPIVIPFPEHETHYEGELVVVIGKEGRDIPPEKVNEYVLGYTCGNDVSDRTIQKYDKQWTRAKSYHTFKPLGPFIATGLDPANLRVRTRVNGEPKQDSTTANMIFNVSALVSYLSRVMTLSPGDVIFTGTPEGVGPLVSGDSCEIEIEGIGILKNPVK